MKTTEYMQAIKARHGIPSDYALAKELGVTKQTISRYAQGKGYFDDEVAIRAAILAGVEPWRVLLDMHIERSKTPEIRAAWAGMMEKISGSFLNLLSGNGPRHYRISAR